MDWFRELQTVQSTPLDTHNQAKRDDDQRIQASLGQQILTPQDPLTEVRTTDNAWLLGSGDHGGLAIKAPNGSLIGVPGAVVKDTLATISAEGTLISGVTFQATTAQAASAARLVDVLSGTVVFTNCRFEKTLGGTTDGDFVRIADGAKAVFIGCFFGPVQTTGALCVNHLGTTATDVGLIGTSNKTGLADANVTVVFQV